jgi:hypothetical protein
MSVEKRIENIKRLLPEEKKFFKIEINVVGNSERSEMFREIYQDEPVVERGTDFEITTIFTDTKDKPVTGLRHKSEKDRLV